MTFFLISMTGRQVVEVPCANIGGFENVIAICHQNVDIQKVKALVFACYLVIILFPFSHSIVSLLQVVQT